MGSFFDEVYLRGKIFAFGFWLLAFSQTCLFLLRESQQLRANS